MLLPNYWDVNSNENTKQRKLLLLVLDRGYDCIYSSSDIYCLGLHKYCQHYENLEFLT